MPFSTAINMPTSQPIGRSCRSPRRGAALPADILPGAVFAPHPAARLTLAGHRLLPYAMAFQAITPRFSGRGILFNEERTNRCTNHNASPQQLVTPTTLAAFNALGLGVTASGGDGNTRFGVVDDAAALQAADLDIGNGRVWFIDNSTGASAALMVPDGTAGAVDETFAASAYARAEGAAGNTGVQGIASSDDFVTGGGYVRRERAATTLHVGNQMFVRAFAGSKVWFTLNQFEQGPTATAPIIVAGETATRNADTPKAMQGADGTPFPGWTAGGFPTAGAYYWSGRRVAASTGDASLIVLDDDTSNNRLRGDNNDPTIGGGFVDSLRLTAVTDDETQAVNEPAAFLANGVAHVIGLRWGGGKVSLWRWNPADGVVTKLYESGAINLPTVNATSYRENDNPGIASGSGNFEVFVRAFVPGEPSDAEMAARMRRLGRLLPAA